MKSRIQLGVFLSLSFSFGCMPSYLSKYQKKDVASSSSKTSASPSEGSSSSGKDSDSKAGARATVYAVDRQTYRFALKEDDIWDSALQVLLKNYNLTIVDRSSGVVTTEWDTFYIKNAVYRNKLSIRLRRVNRDIVEVTLRNNVERLQDGSFAGTVGAVWLPGEDPGNEVVRVVQNMALTLNQPPPVVPPEQVARGIQPANRGATTPANR